MFVNYYETMIYIRIRPLGMVAIIQEPAMPKS